MNSRRLTRVIVALSLLMPLQAQAGRGELPVQGYVIDTNTGDPIDGRIPMEFNLYADCDSDDSLWSHSQFVEFDEGLYATTIEPDEDIISENEELCLGITIGDDDEMSPRLSFHSVPFASLADSADHASNADVAETALAVSGDNLPDMVGSGLTVADDTIVLDTSSSQTWTGSQTYSSQVVVSRSPTTTSSSDAALRINPASSVTNAKAFVIQDNGTDKFSVDKEGDVVIGGNLTVTGSLSVSGIGDISSVSAGDGLSGGAASGDASLAVDESFPFVWTGAQEFQTDVSFTLAGTENISLTSDLAGAVNMLSLVGTPSSTAAVTSGLFLQQADSANTNGLDSAVSIDNADADLAVTAGIAIANSGGGGYTKFLDTPSLDISGSGAISGATGLTSSGTITLSNLVSCTSVVTNGSGVLSCGSGAIEGGDITSVGSMVSGVAFGDATADDDWLGLGSGAGRIEFDDQATDEVNILDAKLGIGNAAPDYSVEISDSTNTPKVALSDDDVAHGLTSVVQTDVFSHFSSVSTTAGGVEWLGLSDTDAQAMSLWGIIGSTDPTDAIPAVKIVGSKSDGTTGIADLGAAETVFSVANNDESPALIVYGNGNVAVSGTLTSSGGTAVGDITGITAGNGLTGTATSGAATLDVGAGTGISVAADAISLDQSVAASWTGAHTFNTDIDMSFSGSENIAYANSSATTDQISLVASIADTNSADAVQITITDNTSTSGNARGLVVESGDGAASLDSALAISHTDTGQAMTAGIEIYGAASTAITTAIDVDDAEIGTAIAIGSNDVTVGGVTISSTEFAALDNFSASSLGDITSITAGDGLTGTATSGDATLAVGAGTGITVAADAVSVDQSTAFTWTGSHTYNFGFTGKLLLNAATSDNSGTAGILDIDVDADNAAVDAVNIDLEQADGVTGGQDATGLEMTLTQSDADGDMFGVTITGAATANAAAGSYEAAIKIDNAEETVASMTDGLVILSSGADGGLTDAIDVSNGNITNAMNVGANPIVTGDAAGTIGDSTTDSWTFVTDGTGTGEIVLPNESIGSAEIADATIAGADLAANIAITSTGAQDFGGAPSVEVPNGTGPTVDASGEVAVDTTNDQLLYYGSSALNVITAKHFKSITLESPADADNILVFKTPYAITITNVDCVIDPADAAESVVIDVQERDGTGDNPATVDTTITCDNDGASDDGSFSNAAIDAGDWVSLDIGAVTGTVTQVNVTITYTITRT